MGIAGGNISCICGILSGIIREYLAENVYC